MPTNQTKELLTKQNELPTTQYESDHDRFRVLPDNRPVSRSHVQSLVHSFQENPTLIKLRPILVNENMEVVDGQHRLEACKVLEIPVPYQIVPTLTIATAQLMNALQRSWRLIDFIHSYAGSGKVEFQQIERYMDTFAPVGPSVALAYADAVGYHGESTRKRARMGILELLPKEVIEDRLGKLSDLPIDFWHYDSLAMAFLRVLRTAEDYDHHRMVEGIKNIDMKRQSTFMDSLRELERAYNFNKKVDIVRFF